MSAISAITVLIVDKTGVIKETLVKNFLENELYKKAGLKTSEDFKYQTEWNIEDIGGKSYAISVYGKTTGRANQENKYEFPPPVDTTLFFGNCILVNKENNVATNLTVAEWNAAYDYLFGGFEDLDDEDEEEDDDDDDEDDGLPRTKLGYVKDGFVVDDEEEVEDEEEEEDEEEVEDEDEEEDDDMPKKRSKKTSKSIKKKAEPKSGKKKAAIVTPIPTPEPVREEFLDCTSELSEEEYV